MIPYHQAMGLLLTGRKVPAAEMYRLGLVNEVAPADELDDVVQRWVDDVLACAPLSLKAIKQTVQRTAHLTAREANTVRLPALVAALQSKDQDEGCAPSRRSAPRSGADRDPVPGRLGRRRHPVLRLHPRRRRG